jgi:hypothetical protein
MAKNRCRPGDMVRIVYSLRPQLIGQIAIVEQWMPEHDRWGIRLISGKAICPSATTGLLIVASLFVFKDSSLEPLRGEEDLPASHEQTDEVRHG